MRIPRQRIFYSLQAAGIAAGFGLLRLMPVDWASALGGFLARSIGPRLKVSDVARRNLAAAFPEKGAAEREAILRGVWDNLGRTGAEYSQLDRIFDTGPDGPVIGGRIQADPDTVERFLALRDDGRPAIIFTGHCANWELLPIGAARHGLSVVVFFRPPNNPFAADLVRRIRRRSMGRLLPSGLLGVKAASEALEQGEHLGMLVDQHYGLGLPIPFFGRPAQTAATLAKLARRFRCPVHGAFVERIGGTRFRLVVQPALEIRWTDDAESDVRNLMIEVNKAIEDWVRRHPGQWLWLHRRWR
ncbi:MAG TPA: lipid A biosynthesis lauroyl acyltransferase [Dongiaceae bacterium]|nr:lipid A biosynthesis lauroyl acyltransferase [Dongiaceae bacterium]